MSKDHTPSDFGREGGYKSDVELAETQVQAKSINTSFGSRNHNIYVMRTDGTHEHFFYDPASGKSGWHGHNYETHNNHPNIHPEPEGSTSAVEKNSFIESLKVDQATIDRCDAVSREAAQSRTEGKSAGIDEGGRERGDDGPGSLGRESGLKSSTGSEHSEGEAIGNGGQTVSEGMSAGQGSQGGQGAGGQSGSGQGAGGQGAGSHGAGGQGNGGQGGGHGVGGQGGH